jgi:hypothetical protein
VERGITKGLEQDSFEQTGECWRLQGETAFSVTCKKQKEQRFGIGQQNSNGAKPKETTDNS